MEGRPAKGKQDLQNGNQNHKMEAGTTKWKPEPQNGSRNHKMETGIIKWKALKWKPEWATVRSTDASVSSTLARKRKIHRSSQTGNIHLMAIRRTIFCS